ncbi:sigma-70 family RNA polymerase sigma factor [Catalinimonas sp. 4WD22]|uniref:RNA polymerase sigma factor n=1 Tax=Catalinimonas locisalis TaxID=3133978 RepID=UPI00310134F6
MYDHSEEAFVELYNIFFEDLCRYGKRITNQKALIEDSIQDLFVEIWKNKKDLPEVNSVKYYLYKRLKRKIIKKLIDKRKIPLENNVLEEYNFNIVFSHESELISKQFSEDQQKKLQKALNSLSRRQKEAITLRFYDGFTTQEVAGLLSMNTKSVRNLIYRAMLVLKKVLLKLIVLFSVISVS